MTKSDVVRNSCARDFGWFRLASTFHTPRSRFVPRSALRSGSRGSSCRSSTLPIVGFCACAAPDAPASCPAFGRKPLICVRLADRRRAPLPLQRARHANCSCPGVAHAALLPALALLAGIVLGVWGEVPVAAGVLLLCAALPLSIGSLLTGRARLVVTGVVASWVAAGVVLGARAETSARDPPLRRALDPGVEGPVILTGVLTEDASPVPNGVSLSLHVTTWSRHGPTHAADDGVLVTVGGRVEARRIRGWTRGRLVRMPAWLREPARYRDAGVPDHALALARRGVALVGSVKSASLVEVLAPGGWIDETAAAHQVARAAAGRREHRRAEPAGRRCGDRDPDWGPRGARSGGRAAVAGGRHVSRHRHLWWQHRHPRRMPARHRAGAGTPVPAGARGYCLWPRALRAGRGGRVLGAARDPHGDRVSRGAGDRPSERGREHDGGGGHRDPLCLAAGAGGSGVPSHLRRDRSRSWRSCRRW